MKFKMFEIQRPVRTLIKVPAIFASSRLACQELQPTKEWSAPVSLEFNPSPPRHSLTNGSKVMWPIKARAEHQIQLIQCTISR